MGLCMDAPGWRGGSIVAGCRWGHGHSVFRPLFSMKRCETNVESEVSWNSSILATLKRANWHWMVLRESPLCVELKTRAFRVPAVSLVFCAGWSKCFARTALMQLRCIMRAVWSGGVVARSLCSGDLRRSSVRSYPVGRTEMIPCKACM